MFESHQKFHSTSSRFYFKVLFWCQYLLLCLMVCTYPKLCYLPIFSQVMDYEISLFVSLCNDKTKGLHMFHQILNENKKWWINLKANFILGQKGCETSYKFSKFSLNPKDVKQCIWNYCEYQSFLWWSKLAHPPIIFF